MLNNTRGQFRRLLFAWAILFVADLEIASQTITLKIQRKDSQVIVSWPGELGAVQPQLASSITGPWEDIGSATLTTNLVQSISSANAFYRLRLPTSTGIYMGIFPGQTNGGIAALVQTNAQAALLAYHLTQNEGVWATNFPLAADGAFAVTTDKEGKLSGNIRGDVVEGALVSTNAQTATFKATRKASTGVHQANAGYYEGTFGGVVTGNSSFVLAADGTAFVYVSSPGLGGGGTFGEINAANSLSASVLYALPGGIAPATIVITGKLNPATHLFSGTYSVGGFTLGTFSMSRVSAP